MEIFFITPLLILLILVAIMIIVFSMTAVFLVQQAEAIIIERLGRYHRTLDAGLHVIMPFMMLHGAHYGLLYFQRNRENINDLPPNFAASIFGKRSMIFQNRM